MISTRDLSDLPDVRRLQAAFQSMAMLDAIIMPDWQYRYYSFEAPTFASGGISIGSMRNGSGDDLHAIFGHVGCLIRGFAHEYPLTPYANEPPQVFPGVVSDVPREFRDCLAALHSDWWQMVTFCVWRRYSDTGWSRGAIDFPGHPDPDGSAHFLSPYDGRPETYHRWAESYYDGRLFDLDAIRWVFQHRPLSDEVVRSLNPVHTVAELAEEMKQIGYPHQRYPLPSSWPSAVVELAQALYDGAGDRLVLADALEEAGHQELADHFRAEEWHPKGCWVTDVVLAKT